MKKNSVIAENILKSVIEKFTMTEAYVNARDAVFAAEKDFMSRIENDAELLDKYLEIESFTSGNQTEYESICFCEGFRLGFKLCMDIFNL